MSNAPKTAMQMLKQLKVTQQKPRPLSNPKKPKIMMSTKKIRQIYLIQENDNKDFLNSLVKIINSDEDKELKAFEIISAIYNFIESTDVTPATRFYRRKFLPLIDFGIKMINKYITSYFDETQKNYEKYSSIEYLDIFMNRPDIKEKLGKEYWKEELKHFINSSISEYKKSGKDPQILYSEFQKPSDADKYKGKGINLKSLREMAEKRGIKTSGLNKIQLIAKLTWQPTIIKDLLRAQEELGYWKDIKILDQIKLIRKIVFQSLNEKEVDDTNILDKEEVKDKARLWFKYMKDKKQEERLKKFSKSHILTEVETIEKWIKVIDEKMKKSVKKIGEEEAIDIKEELSDELTDLRKVKEKYEKDLEIAKKKAAEPPKPPKKVEKERDKIIIGSCESYYIAKPWLTEKEGSGLQIKQTLINITENDIDNISYIQKYIKNIPQSELEPDWLVLDEENFAKLMCRPDIKKKQEGDILIVSIPEEKTSNGIPAHELKFKLGYVTTEGEIINQDESIFKKQIDFLDNKFLPEKEVVQNLMKKILEFVDWDVRNALKEITSLKIFEALNKINKDFPTIEDNFTLEEYAEVEFEPITARRRDVPVSKSYSKDFANELATIFYEKNESKTIGELFNEVAEFLISLSQEVLETSEIFRTRLKLHYFTPKGLYNLSLEDKIPEIFLNKSIDMKTKREIINELTKQKNNIIGDLGKLLYDDINPGKRLGGDWKKTEIDKKVEIFKDKSGFSYVNKYDIGKACEGDEYISVFEENYDIVTYFDAEDKKIYCFSVYELREAFEEGNFFNSFTERPFSDSFVEKIMGFSDEPLDLDYFHQQLLAKEKLQAPSVKTPQHDPAPGFEELLERELANLKKKVLSFNEEMYSNPEEKMHGQEEEEEVFEDIYSPRELQSPTNEVRCIHCEDCLTDSALSSIILKNGEPEIIHFCSCKCMEDHENWPKDKK